MHFVQKDVNQDTKGYISVVVQDIELIKKRLAAVKEALEGSKFRCTSGSPPVASFLHVPAAQCTSRHLCMEHGEAYVMH